MDQFLRDALEKGIEQDCLVVGLVGLVEVLLELGGLEVIGDEGQDLGLDDTGLHLEEEDEDPVGHGIAEHVSHEHFEETVADLLFQ